MVRVSGIREKLRSNVLKELARERGTKRTKEDVRKEESDDEDEDRQEQEKLSARAKLGTSSLLSILPKPKNSNAFGPTVKLETLLKMPERASEIEINTSAADDNCIQRVAEDGMIEVDISKVTSDVSQTAIKELTMEKGKSNIVIVPKGKEKQKNQITYLAQLGKANELERKEQAAQSRINKAAARSKYGW